MKCGKVESLWVYPVKSLMGECLQKLNIEERGVAGDRLFAISDSNGKFGSGKNTRRFRRINGLFSLSAKVLVNGVAIRFSDGSVLTNTDSLIDRRLSEMLGQSVTLTKERDISHFDDGAIHLLTTASLSLLSKRLRNSAIDSRRFRPNIVIKSDYLDQDLIGKRLKIGQAVIEITNKTERCHMITMRQSDLEKKTEILKTIAKDFDLNFGVYAKVISTGVISVGENVEIFNKET